MRHSIPVFCLALTVLAPLSAAADKTVPAAKPYFVANCFNCHGTDGRATGATPSLAGLDKNYFIEQIKQFRSGARPATIMQQLAKGYTDDEITIAAEFFAKQKK